MRVCGLNLSHHIEWLRCSFHQLLFRPIHKATSERGFPTNPSNTAHVAICTSLYPLPRYLPCSIASTKPNPVRWRYGACRQVVFVVVAAAKELLGRAAAIYLCEVRCSPMCVWHIFLAIWSARRTFRRATWRESLNKLYVCGQDAFRAQSSAVQAKAAAPTK